MGRSNFVENFWNRCMRERGRITTVKKSASRWRRRRRIIAEELAKLDWEEADVARRRKGDVGKVRIARRLRRETTVSKRWIAKQLSMGR